MVTEQPQRFLLGLGLVCGFRISFRSLGCGVADQLSKDIGFVDEDKLYKVYGLSFGIHLQGSREAFGI